MKSSIFCIFLIILICSFNSLVFGFTEINKTTVVTSVINEVTFETETQEIFKLADIEATCTDIENSTGFITAKSLLSSLVLGKTVYLDIDSFYITDNYGTGNRTVCVVYIDFNSTHYLNVNQVLVKQRLVAIKDAENDFNPNNWTHYVAKPIEPKELKTPTELGQPIEPPLITTEIAIITVGIVAGVIGVAVFWLIPKNKKT